MFEVYNLINLDRRLCVHEIIPIIKTDHTHPGQKVPWPHYYVPTPLLHYPTDLLFVTVVQSEFAGILYKWNVLFFVWLRSLIIVTLRFTILLHVSITHSSSLLSGIPRCVSPFVC